MTTDEMVRHALNEAAWVLCDVVAGREPDLRAADHARAMCDQALVALRPSGNSNVE